MCPRAGANGTPSLHRLGVTSVNQEKIAQRLNFNKLEDLLAAIGRGDVSTHSNSGCDSGSYAGKGRGHHQTGSNPPRLYPCSASGILIEGVGNLLTKMAKCCNLPLPTL